MCIGLPLGDLIEASPFDVEDVQPLCHARGIAASGHPQSAGESQPDCLYCMVHFRSCRNIVARGEPIGVAILVVIGVAPIALAPAKQPLHPASNEIGVINPIAGSWRFESGSLACTPTVAPVGRLCGNYV